MASYTTQLRTLIEQPTQYQTLSMSEKIEEGRKSLFDFEYPIFDENYRKIFETNFIRHFFMREIGFETEGLFKFQLETWLNIHMPYFNNLFQSELIEYDPLINSRVDVTSNETSNKTQSDIRNITRNETVDKDTTFSSSNTNNKTGTGTSNETNATDDFNRQIESDNPDSRLALTTNDGEGVIEYANKITENNENNNHTMDSTTNTTENETGSQTGSGTEDLTNNETRNDVLNTNVNNVEDFVQSRVGKIGVQTYSEMIVKYRQSLLRVEKEIFNEMNQLFMLVY